MCPWRSSPLLPTCSETTITKCFNWPHHIWMSNSNGLVLRFNELPNGRWLDIYYTSYHLEVSRTLSINFVQRNHFQHLITNMAQPTMPKLSSHHLASSSSQKGFTCQYHKHWILPFREKNIHNHILHIVKTFTSNCQI